MKVHAFLRNPTEQISIEFQNRVLKFAPNDAGHVIAELDDAVALDLIDAAPCSFKQYGEVPAAIRAKSGAPLKFDGDLDDDEDDNDSQTGDDQQPAGSGDAVGGDGSATGVPTSDSSPTTPAGGKGPFVITSPSGQDYDLAAMTDDEVRALASNAGVKNPHHTKKGDALRADVIEKLKALVEGE